MNKKTQVLVYVGDDERSTNFMEASNTYVLGAPTLRIALAQIMFSNPDAVIIDAMPENMLLAEDTYFHMRTLRNIPVVILSDMLERWDTVGDYPVSIVPNDANPEEILIALGKKAEKDMAIIS